MGKEEEGLGKGKRGRERKENRGGDKKGRWERGGMEEKGGGQKE